MNDFPQFICAGEALTDLICTEPNQWKSLVGGSTWNVARSLSKLGLSSGFAGAISQDLFGDALYQASAEAKLDLRFLQRHNKSPLLAIVSASSPPTYFFVGDDSADLYFSPSNLPNGWSKQVKWAHFGGISLAREPLASTLIDLARTLKTQGVKISYDPNFRNLMNASYDTTLQVMTGLTDVVKVSDDDLRGLFRTNDADGAFAQLRALNPDALYLYTRGALGASLHKSDQSWRASVPSIQIVDTVGAGDASIAGLLFSLHTFPHRSYQEHLNFSVATGTAACLSAGAQAPTIEQVEVLYKPIA